MRSSRGVLARQRIRTGSTVAAAMLGTLALGALGVPLLHQSLSQAAATRLPDGTLAAPDLGALEQLPASGMPAGEPSRIAVAAGVVARSHGESLQVTSFSQQPPREAALELGGDVVGLALSPTADLLAVVDATGALSMFGLGAATPTALSAATVTVGRATEAAIATTADGAFVGVAAGGSRRVQLHDRRSGAVRSVEVDEAITALAAGPGSRLYALTDDAVFVLDAAAGRVTGSAIAPPDGPTGVGLVDDGASLALWNDAELLLLDPSTLHAAARYDPSDPITGAADGSTDGTLMVGLGGSAPRLALVELGSGRTLSEIRFDGALPLAFGSAERPASLLVATPEGVVLGSWEASRVPWPIWWATAAALALLACACAAVALLTGRARAPAVALAVPPAVAQSITEHYPARLTVEPRTLAARLTRPAHPSRSLEREAARAPATIHDRIHTLAFEVGSAADEQGVVQLVRDEALVASAGATRVAVDRSLIGRTLTGSVSMHGVRLATFIVTVTPQAEGGSRARFRVPWFLVSPATVPFVPGDEEAGVGFEPLRDLAQRLEAGLERLERRAPVDSAG